MIKIQSGKITIIYDDLNGVEEGFIKSFGFAALIELEDVKILFDVGTKDDILKANLSALNIIPSVIDAVILSHNHYDHTNGLSAITRENPSIPVYVHKYWSNPVHHIGNPIPLKNKRIIEEGRMLEEIGVKIYVTNCFKSREYGGIYEQACYFEVNESNVLVCGCSHPGLNVFLEDRKILGISNNRPLHIIGGFHGFKFDNQNMKKLNPYLKSIIIYHCTKNIQTFKSQFKEKCSLGIVGKPYIF